MASGLKKTLSLRLLLIAGLLWATTEIVFGSLMRPTCAREMTGSVLTGTSLMFISFAYRIGGGLWLVLPLAVTMAAKALGAAALGRPVLSGAVLNPCYAYCTQVISFVLVVQVIGQRREVSPLIEAASGAAAGLLAAGLFPLAGHVTGYPACIHEPSGLPLAIYYAPVAAMVSALAVPLGNWAAKATLVRFTGGSHTRPSPRAVLDATALCALAGFLIAQAVLG